MSLRRILFWIHLTAGCFAGSVVLIMSVTGVLLAYQRQITSWFDGDLRSNPPALGAARLPVGAILAPIATQKGSTPSAITLRAAPDAAAEVSFGREHVFFVDVYTGKVMGEGSKSIRTFFQTVENWHRWLGAGNEHRALGRAITGASNLGFLVLVLSGPFLWIPRKWSWRNLKTVLWFPREFSGKARDFNWHNVIGIWCAVPLFFIILSGVVMSYPWANDLLYRLTGSEPPAQGREPREGNENRRARNRQAASGLDPYRLNASWPRAEQQAPGWQSLTMRLPASGRGPITFTIDAGSGGRPDLRGQLIVDARTAEVIRWEPFSSYDAGRRLRSWFRFLHTGEAGGVGGQTIAGVASGGAAILVWTGLCLAFRRLWSWRKRGPAKSRHAKYQAIASCN